MASTECYCNPRPSNGVCTYCLHAEVRELEDRLEKLTGLAEMVMDNTKMPHQHTDPQLRLYCLAERAKEILGAR